MAEQNNNAKSARNDNEENADKNKSADEKKRLKQEKIAQKKEAKKKIKELSAQVNELDEDEEPGGLPVFVITVLIIVIWLTILCVLVKLDVGGIGSNVLSPVLKNIPVVNQILPSNSPAADTGTGSATDSYSGYTNLKDAVAQIKSLEQQLAKSQSDKLADDDQITKLKAEVDRLKTFEDQQTAFERIKTEFYEEVVYADKGPGEAAYKKYYESMDPTTAEYLYKQVVQDQQASAKIQDYVATYSAMKPAQAAAIFDTMTDNLDLVAKILQNMDSDSRAKIMGAMSADTAAKVTKILNPNS
jgi:flagellar motility protein MotE (MotC chaperone)